MALDDAISADKSPNDGHFKYHISPPNPRTSSQSMDDVQKRKGIEAACEGPGDLESLISLATSTNGLIDDNMRRQAWPILLGCGKQGSAVLKAGEWENLPPHKDESQVELDVNRSFIYYPQSNETGKQLDRRKAQLSALITQTLREHPALSYFQGYHDIVQVFLLVLGPDQAVEAVARLSLLRIRDFMLPSLTPSLDHLSLLPVILYLVDSQLSHHLSQTQPFFALAATLTLYAHDIQEYSDIGRLFDFLIAQPAVVSIYFFAVIILSRREELFDIPAEEPEMLHSVLSKLPKPLDLESLISKTMILFDEHPPEKLPSRAWTKIPYCSVLKTTRASNRNESLGDGEDFLEMQVLYLRRQELRKKALAKLWLHRRPIGGLGIAIMVGLASLWLGRRGFDGSTGFGLRYLWRQSSASR